MNKFRVVVMGMSCLLFGHISEAQVGSNWTEVTLAAPWAPRAYFEVLGFNGEMWVMGNGLGNDVWYSPDGVTWTEATSAASWSGRQEIGAASFNGRMWVLGGHNGGGILGDVWSSADGTNWTQVTSAAPWGGRYELGAVTFNGQMWVFGGEKNGNSGSLNDVWSGRNELDAGNLRRSVERPVGSWGLDIQQPDVGAGR